jgi:epoxyqueuosine reductase QueG
MSQEVCPWNVKFARPNRVAEFAPRAVLASNDARAIARALLTMSQEEFSAAFKGSPMKRAKLRGLQRNASVVLSNVGDEGDVDIPIEAFDDREPLGTTTRSEERLTTDQSR